MGIIRWDPFDELDDVQVRLNRLLSGRLDNPATDGPAFGDWAPAVDVRETDKEYLIKADLPEVRKEDVKVEFQDGFLTVEGERNQEKEENGTRFHKIEREYGKFVRRFALPTEVDTANVQAEFKDGVLNVHLPKSATALPRTIEVKVA